MDEIYCLNYQYWMIKTILITINFWMEGNKKLQSLNLAGVRLDELGLYKCVTHRIGFGNLSGKLIIIN